MGLFVDACTWLGIDGSKLRLQKSATSVKRRKGLSISLWAELRSRSMQNRASRGSGADLSSRALRVQFKSPPASVDGREGTMATDLTAFPVAL
jgi:hypothetical protein